VSVKDQWVGTHKQVLNVVTTCWRYGPNKLMLLLINRSLAFSTASRAVRGERNYVVTHGSVSRHARDIVGIPFFSGAVTLSKVVDE
jgi:hypothetical protein